MTPKTLRMQTLQHKRDTLQTQYDLTSNRLQALRTRRGIETDVNERFKLDADIESAEADLHRLGEESDDLDQKIQAIEAGKLRLDEVLSQYDLQSPNKSQQPRTPWVAAVGTLLIVGVIGGILANSHSNSGTNSVPQGTNSVSQSPSQSQTELDSRFAGTWSTEGDHSTPYMMELKIANPQNNQLSGTLTSQKRNGGPSGELSLSGNGQRDTVNVTIFSHDVKSPDGDGQLTQPVWQAELKLEGENLVWRSPQGSNDYFPAVVTLSRVPGSSAGN